MEHLCHFGSLNKVKYGTTHKELMYISARIPHYLRNVRVWVLIFFISIYMANFYLPVELLVLF